MINGFEDFQKLGKENMDQAMKSFGSFSKGFQALATEMTDYSKKSFEDGAATFEKLMSAKSLDKAVEIQTDYVKASYEGFVAQATKVGELYADLAKDAYKPLEGMVAKAGK
jgi:phasin family protein